MRYAEARDILCFRKAISPHRSVRRARRAEISGLAPNLSWAGSRREPPGVAE